MKDVGIQCDILKFYIPLYPATLLSIPKNAAFESTEKWNARCDFGVQTYDAEKHRELSDSSEAVEILLVEAFQRKALTNGDLKEFFAFLEQLTDDSILTLRNVCLQETLNNIESLICFSNYQLRVFQLVLSKARLKYEKEKNLFLKIMNGDSRFLQVPGSTAVVLPSIPLVRIIQYAVEKGSKNKQKRKTAIEKFKKLVRFVLINRQWLNTLNRKRRRDLLSQYKEHDDDKDKYRSKNAIIMFDKHQYKAEWSLFLLSGAHRRILGKSPNMRSNEEIEMLDKIVMNIAKLNSFPKHIRKHIAQLLELVVYDKGREIVREGHEAVGFYVIISGSCDVLFSDIDGILKIDELHVGDSFGGNSFNKDGKTQNTVITSQTTELIMVMPGEIESFIQNLRKTEHDDMLWFASNWFPFKYWNWTEENLNSFITNATYLRFTKCDIIYGNTKQPSNTVYFILKGSVELLRLLRIPSANDHKLYKICTLKADNYFGSDDETSIDTWYMAKNDVNIITISFESFVKIHPYAEFLLLKLKEDLKFWLPSVDQEHKKFKEISQWEKFANKMSPANIYPTLSTSVKF